MNIFGHRFKVSIFGESHGASVGVIIDGCPAGIEISESDFTDDLNRRRAGNPGTTPRIEADIPLIKSGFFQGKTTGSPIMLEFENNNIISKSYNPNLPRPGHSDFTAFHKFRGFNDYRGGGHFSGRLTVGLTAAGVIAKKIIAPINVQAKIIEVGGSKDIQAKLQSAIDRKDSVGGIIECKAQEMPIGLGEPFFYSVESAISQIIFSVPAVIGIEFGRGFPAAQSFGTELIDNYIDATGKKELNVTGGISGGITNGNDLIFRVAIKPTSSIPHKHQTINLETGTPQEIEIQGRHDVCIALRAEVVIEAVTAIALADLKLLA